MKLGAFPVVLLLSLSHALPSSTAVDKTSRSPRGSADLDIPQLFSENTTAKIWRVSLDLLEELPDKSPEKVPSSGLNTGSYDLVDSTYWTAGFFPGSLYDLFERSVRFPDHFPVNDIDRSEIHDQLLGLAHKWTEPLYEQASRTDTHDLGFMIMPALRKDWELTGNQKSLDAIVTAAHSLASRFDSRVNAIRSWDSLQNKELNITDKETNFLIIVDSMCNMDLLYYAGHHTSNQTLIDIATKHSHTVLRDIVRQDYSTFHCCNINPQTDELIWQKTVQGYKDWSTWTRGQAWTILGFTQTYKWTNNPVFLDAAKGVSDYFIDRLNHAKHTHPYVPLWDFDAPTVDGKVPPRDTSAATAAATGLLKLHQTLKDDSPYLEAAIKIISQTVDLSYPNDPASLGIDSDGNIEVTPLEGKWDALFMNATENNNEFSVTRSSNTGIVYADYYFLEFGNALLNMGFV